MPCAVSAGATIPVKLRNPCRAGNAPASGFLPQAYIKQCQPILKGLQAKTAEDEPNTEGSEPALGKAVSIVLDEGIHRNSDPGDQAGHQSHPDCKWPGMVGVMHKSAANERRDRIADGSDNGPPELRARQARAARRHIIQSRTHAPGVGEYLAERDQDAKCHCEFPTQDPVQRETEGKPADGAEKTFPAERVMVKAASGAIEFNGQGDAGGDARDETKEQAKADTVADSKND